MPLPTAEVKLSLGGGKLYFTETGGVERDIGGVQEFSFGITPENIKAADKTKCINTTLKTMTKSIEGTISFMTENIDDENLKLAMLGTLGAKNYASGDELPDGTTATETLAVPHIQAAKKPIMEGRLKFVGAGCDGKVPVYIFPRVSISPSGEFSPLSDGFANLQFSGEIMPTEENGEMIYYEAFLI